MAKKTTEPKPVVAVRYFERKPEPVATAVPDAPKPVAAVAVAPKQYFGPCFICGRGEQREEFCSQCQADQPLAWSARQGLVAGPLMTAEEQERTDRAVRVVLDQFFGLPSLPMLAAASGNKS